MVPPKGGTVGGIVAPHPPYYGLIARPRGAARLAYRKDFRSVFLERSEAPGLLATDD